MRLRTQFWLLILALVLVPLLVEFVFVSLRAVKNDPRFISQEFFASLAELWTKEGELKDEAVKKLVRSYDFPSDRFVVFSRDGDILYSGITADISGKSVLETVDAYLLHKNTTQLCSIEVLVPQNPQSPLILFDQQPLFVKSDSQSQSWFFYGSLVSSVLVIASLISFFILRSIRRSILKLEVDSRLIAQGKLDHEVEIRGSTEFRSLAASINFMRDSLKEQVLRQSKLFMGLSHDLKTPVSLISGYADALADNKADDPQIREKYLGIIQKKSRQLEELIEEFITLARLQYDTNLLPLEELDPGEFLHDLGQRFAEDAALLGRPFVWGFGSGCDKEARKLGPLLLRKNLAERALENLFSNALRYGFSGTEIRLELHHEGNRASAFVMVDEGPGISDKDRPFVFDPFYRVSPSRQDGGHGLGLSIVKAIAELNGWKVELSDRSDGVSGTRARLSLAAV